MVSQKIKIVEAVETALRKYGDLKQQSLEPEEIKKIAQGVGEYFEVIPSQSPQSQTNLDVDERKVVFENEGGLGGAVSIKAENIIVNWRETLEFMSSFVMNSAGVASQPWLIPFAAISSIQSAQKVLRIEFQEKLAMVLWIIGAQESLDIPITTESILEKTNSEYPKFNRPQIAHKELDIIMEELEELRCIEQIEEDLWRLKEKGVVAL